MALPASSAGGRLTSVESVNYWRTLNPELSITDWPLTHATDRYRVDVPVMDTYVRQIIQEGYTQLPPLIPGVESDRLAEAVTRIHRLGLPPVFGFVYDEFWQL